jgi:2-oxoglutarate dehydrogenase E2 component (dihydrolipoamide succinyltransferase)
MSTPVVMPQMGESITEGTIVRWIKKVGDVVDRDEPLLEISTDKVDAEIPAPVAGVLVEIKVAEGETVPVNSVVGTIDSGSMPAEVQAGAEKTTDSESMRAELKLGAAGASESDDDRQRTSPVVRRIAKEHNVDVTKVRGTGDAGRVTRDDVLRYVESMGRESGAPAAAGAPEAPVHGDERVEVQPLSIMRKKIAEHMVLSRRTSAHVHSVFHVDFATIGRIREAKKSEYERRGVKLTYMAFIVRAVAGALRHHPLINASLDGTNILLKKDINIGIAVAIEGGLIVPVVRRADELDMTALCRAIGDLADRARGKQLNPEEVQGGTFTITNPGQFGAQFGMPIINQPQVAILGVGTVEKRPVVVEDAVVARPMAYLTLGYDHRLIDGATADQFMADVKRRIEQFDDSAV